MRDFTRECVCGMPGVEVGGGQRGERGVSCVEIMWVAVSVSVETVSARRREGGRNFCEEVCRQNAGGGGREEVECKVLCARGVLVCRRNVGRQSGTWTRSVVLLCKRLGKMDKGKIGGGLRYGKCVSWRWGEITGTGGWKEARRRCDRCCVSYSGCRGRSGEWSGE